MELNPEISLQEVLNAVKEFPSAKVAGFTIQVDKEYADDVTPFINQYKKLPKSLHTANIALI